MTIGVIRFPGTNNEYDVLWALNDLGIKGVMIPYFAGEELTSKRIKAVIIPGGFSYGDYLRPGAIAARTELARILKEVAEDIPILGVCNGYQILTEMNLLDGSFLPNKSAKFICKWVYLKRENSLCQFFKNGESRILRLPIAHFEGALELEDLQTLFAENKVSFRYCTGNGVISADSNPNGSAANIAGTCNGSGTILGLMPHPERAVRALQGSQDGLAILKGFVGFAYA
ncbi:MAG: phosphoribosylformylglycinamidine synthase I [Candidatus Hodarchaeota archaeon]